ncbi:hypothetical protein BC941DRAFT_475167 [Chlamydoabsidia padenii]|nr:hypothetical protein BC941DRAFT_475167 [Chlamydoabsidia padenii]
MTPTEQVHSTLSVTSPIIKSADVEARMSNNYSDIYGHYSGPTSTQMMVNKTYSPVPGVQDNGTLYSSPSFGQYGNGTHNHTTILPSPPFIHSTIGSPSPSVASVYSNHHHHHHHQHYTNGSNMTSTSQQASHPNMRTVYLGNVAPDTQISDILDQVRSGIIETARPLPEKSCLFLTFIDAAAATHFYYQVSNRPFTVNGVELKVGWGKPSALPTNLRLALQNGASRNVFLGSLDESVNEDVIREDLKRFGTIEHVRLIREKNIAFVHFLSISNAIKCVNSLPNEGDWQNRRVYYGKDRCCQVIINSGTSTTPNTTMYTSNTSVPSTYLPPLQLPPQPQPQPQHPHYHPHALHHQPIQLQHAYQLRYSPSITYDPYTGATIETYTAAPPPTHQQPAITPAPLPTQLPTTVTGRTTTAHQHDYQLHPLRSGPLATTVTPLHNDMGIYHQHQHQHPVSKDMGNSLTGVANRTIYLGNIHPDTTCEEICNVVRGGILSQIRYMVDKHIAFIAFVDPVLALQFYTQANYHGIVIKSRRLKIGWGKPSSLPGNVIQAVQSGGSRNVYLGNMDDTMTEEKLKQDFSEYGDIELVNTLKEKNCAFVNFTSIAAAIRAIEGIRTKEEYKRFRINYGKDRCGNPPRTLQQQQQQQKGTATISEPTATSPSTNGLMSPLNTSSVSALPIQQDLMALDNTVATTGPDHLDTINPPTMANNLGAESLVDLVAHPTLHLPHTDMDNNNVLNTVIDS